MKRGFNEVFMKNIKENAGIYFIILLFFTIGIAAGAFTVKALEESQKQELVTFINRFFQILGVEQVEGTTILLRAIKNNFQAVFLIWISSIIIIGLPVNLLITGFRGFMVGFTISFFIKGLGWKGIVFSAASILPQNLIYIPCLLIISALSLKYSIEAIRMKFSRGPAHHTKGSLLSYTTTVTIILAIMTIGSLIEAYISPILIKSLSTYMMVQ